MMRPTRFGCQQGVEKTRYMVFTQKWWKWTSFYEAYDRFDFRIAEDTVLFRTESGAPWSHDTGSKLFERMRVFSCATLTLYDFRRGMALIIDNPSVTDAERRNVMGHNPGQGSKVYEKHYPYVPKVSCTDTAGLATNGEQNKTSIAWDGNGDAALAPLSAADIQTLKHGEEYQAAHRAW